MPRPLRVAIVGSGPAGIYAADALLKSEVAADPGVSIDIFERMPAPFGLIRYGVAPDHPRIKGIITALHQVLDKPQIRLFGNVDYPTDINLDDLRAFYDGVIFATGARRTGRSPSPASSSTARTGPPTSSPGTTVTPTSPRTWPLEAEKVAVLGVGNVALDIARVLAKTADELLPTEIPPNVYEGLKANKALEVHVFGRRGPAQAKFSPMELRELDHSPNIEVIVDPEDIDYDEGSIATRRGNKQADMVAKTLENWAIRDVGDRPHKLFLHFFESPSEILGEDGKVVGLRTERTELDGTGNVKGTGEFKDWDVQAVYRAVGYLSDQLPKLPWDIDSGHGPGQGRPGDPGVRRAPAVDARHRLDPARSGRSDRAHQGRRQRDGVQPAGRLRERQAADARLARSGGRGRLPRRAERPLHHLGRLVPARRRGEGAGRAAGP